MEHVRRRTKPRNNIKSSTFEFKGGLNLVDSKLAMAPGELLDVLNYELRSDIKGYRRVEGFERVDGKGAPSESKYSRVPVNLITQNIAEGDVVTGSNSGATGIAMRDILVASGDIPAGTAAGGVFLRGASGDFEIGEQLSSSGGDFARVNGAITIGSGAPDTDTHDLYEKQAVADRRAEVEEAPGAGPLRGGFSFEGDIYVFRDNLAQDAGFLYKATDTGWEMVTTPALLPGGKVRAFVYNFFGTQGTAEVYGVDGVNPYFHFDGTTFSQVLTGAEPAMPSFITHRASHILLGYDVGSVQTSNTGDPYVFGGLGSEEIGVGSRLVGMHPEVGGTIAIGTEDRLYLLHGKGTTESPWDLQTVSDETGAIEGTMQRLTSTRFMNERGVGSMASVDKFGDMESASLSEKVDPFLLSRIDQVSTSCVVKRKGQYRLFFDDGFCLICAFKNDELLGYAPMQYLDANSLALPVRNTFTVEEGATESIYFTSDNGYLYKMDSGNSFDGGPIDYSFTMAYHHAKSPSVEKHWRKVSLEMQGSSGATVRFNTTFDYGNRESPGGVTREHILDSGGGRWDTSNWDAFVWASDEVPLLESKLDGNGRNVSLQVFGRAQDGETPHTLFSATFLYSLRRLVR